MAIANTGALKSIRQRYEYGLDLAAKASDEQRKKSLEWEAQYRAIDDIVNLRLDGSSDDRGDLDFIANERKKTWYQPGVRPQATKAEPTMANDTGSLAAALAARAISGLSLKSIVKGVIRGGSFLAKRLPVLGWAFAAAELAGVIDVTGFLLDAVDRMDDDTFSLDGLQDAIEEKFATMTGSYIPEDAPVYAGPGVGVRDPDFVADDIRSGLLIRPVDEYVSPNPVDAGQRSSPRPVWDEERQAYVIREPQRATVSPTYQAPTSSTLESSTPAGRVSSTNFGGDPVWAPLGDLIESIESKEYGYNALVYKRDGSRGGAADLVNMTIGEVKEYQHRMRTELGHEGDAVGRYQFIGDREDGVGTLTIAQRAAGLSDDDLFSARNQDKMFSALMHSDFMSGGKYLENPTEENKNALLLRLQQTWAAFQTAEGRSYYDKVGQNAASANGTVDRQIQAISDGISLSNSTVNASSDTPTLSPDNPDNPDSRVNQDTGQVNQDATPGRNTPPARNSTPINPPVEFRFEDSPSTRPPQSSLQIQQPMSPRAVDSSLMAGIMSDLSTFS